MSNYGGGMAISMARANLASARRLMKTVKSQEAKDYLHGVIKMHEEALQYFGRDPDEEVRFIEALWTQPDELPLQERIDRAGREVRGEGRGD